MRNETIPEDVVQTVRDLAGRGLSASQIGPQVGKTRSAVIGLCHRRGIVLRGSTCGPRPRRPQQETRLEPKKRGSAGGTITAIRAKMKARAQAPCAPPAEPAKIAPPIESADTAPAPDRPRIASVVDLEPHHCKWPIGDPRHPDFGFCGATALLKDDGSYKPYCADHDRQARPRPE